MSEKIPVLNSAGLYLLSFTDPIASNIIGQGVQVLWHRETGDIVVIRIEDGVEIGRYPEFRSYDDWIAYLRSLKQ